MEVADELGAISKALIERIERMVRGLNDKAVKAAERRVAEIVRGAGEQRELANRELADASDEVENLESQLINAKTELAKLEQRLAEAETEKLDQAVELAQLQERLTQVEAKAQTTEQAHQDQRKKAAKEAHRVAERMEATNTDLDTARKEASAAREEAAGLRGQIDSLQEQNKELVRALGGADKGGRNPGGKA